MLLFSSLIKIFKKYILNQCHYQLILEILNVCGAGKCVGYSTLGLVSNMGCFEHLVGG